MKILNEKPPIYDDIVKAGLMFNPNTTIFAYHDAIYNPSALELPEHIIVHESVHLRQQAETIGGANAWWARYIEDAYFRISQETEAYKAQYQYICSYVKDRNHRYTIARNLATFLSGPMYGNMITLQEAIKKIR